MPVYRAPVRDMSYVINELLNFEQYQEILGFEDADADTMAAILEEGGRLAEEVIHPINQSGDEEGCKLENGEVTTPKGFKEAYKAYVEGGWPALVMNPAYGGQGMPNTLNFLLSEIFSGANHSFFMYPTLTHGATGALEHWGSEELKNLYLPKMTSGVWTGTMNLTEPHAGTDLGMIRTKAEDNGDGTYNVTGTKIFISAGEHDMAENIIHLVLAKLPDSPEGTKGISLFLVPKFMPDADGNPGERNAVTCASIEHKMGIKASATCVLNFDGAKGFLIGEVNKGMRAMFTMMNEARMGVAIEGVGVAEISYQNAVEYARDRLQGRALTGKKNPDKPADPIIVHPDVRRMLLSMRSFTEGARALAAWTNLNADISRHHPDEAEREKAAGHVALMTPICKSFFTDEGFTAANHAVQVYGGHGYIGEHGVEQFVRDARISQLYEGTNGVQSMDMVGRKLPMKGGALVTTWFAELKGLLDDNANNDDMKAYVEPMQAAFGHLQAATQWLMKNGMANPDNAGAAAVEFTRLFSIVAVGSMWVRMARNSLDTLAAGTDDADFYKNKLITGRFYMERYLPECAALLGKMENGADTMMEMAAEAF